MKVYLHMSMLILICNVAACAHPLERMIEEQRIGRIEGIHPERLVLAGDGSGTYVPRFQASLRKDRD